MDWQQTFNRFELDQDARTDDQVQSVPALDEHSLVFDTYRSLALETYATRRKLGAQARLVRGFQQPWTKAAMYLDQSPDHALCSILESSALPPFLFHPQRSAWHRRKLRTVWRRAV